MSYREITKGDIVKVIGDRAKDFNGMGIVVEVMSKEFPYNVVVKFNDDDVFEYFKENQVEIF